MSWVTLDLFVSGLALLLAGAMVLVQGASRLATIVGVSPLAIGLTVVTFGTSTPELAITVLASRAGQPDIALGNVIGSTLFNVLFILGLSALVRPVVVSQQGLRSEVAIMIGISILLWVLALDGISRAEGTLLLAGIAAYTIGSILRASRSKHVGGRKHAGLSGDSGRSGPRWFRPILSILIGLGLLVLGSYWLLDGAVAIGRSLGVSDLVIGLTIIAAATSLPVLATLVTAAVRGERDITVGNVIASNIFTFNHLAILGLGSLVAPTGTGSAVMFGFALPLTIITLVVLIVGASRRPSAHTDSEIVR